MKTLKFVNNDKGQFTATLRKNVNNYFRENGISTKGNWKLFFKSIVMISVYFIPFILILILPPVSGWLIFPLSIIMGVGMAGIGMGVMHDAVHGSFSKKGWVNKLFSASMYIIGGNTFSWKVQHNLMHHTYTNIDGFDGDIEPKGSMRFSKNRPLKKIHRFQHIYAFLLYPLMSFSKIFSEIGQLRRFNKAGITEHMGAKPNIEFIKIILFKATYLAIFVGLALVFSNFSWWLILLGFLTMHFVAGLFMSTVFQMAHVVEEVEQPLPTEEGIMECEWTIHEMKTTANFSRKSKIFAYIIGGLNYQIEHHLFPNISHVHYRAISPIVEQTAKEFGVPYHENRTFISALGSHVRMLKALGR